MSNSSKFVVRPTRYKLAALAGVTALGFAVLSADFSTAQHIEFAAPTGASFADVVERVSPAVVNITVTKTARSMPTVGGAVPRGAPGFEEFFERFFGAPGGQGQPPRSSQGQGSGFIIDASGYIVTNQHVIADAAEVVVTLASGETLDASIVGQDDRTDLALLKVEPSEALHSVAFGDSDRARVGEWVLAIGNPFGLGGTATAGIISARGRDIRSGPYDDYLQIDAPINSGNSGGPVFNGGGEVIGINTAIFSPNGGSVGIGFAIPSNQAELVIAKLKSNGSVERGWLGVQIQDLDADLARTLGIDAVAGALVADVVVGGPAERAGLEPGDVVTRFDTSVVDSARSLSRLVGESDTGEHVEIAIWRDGRTHELTVELGTLEGDERIAGNLSRRGPAASTVLGLTLADLNQAHRARLGLDAGIEGAVVVEVEPGSPAARQGIRPGDLIVGVNRKSTNSAESALSEMDKTRDGKTLVLVRRGDSQRFVALGAA